MTKNWRKKIIAEKFLLFFWIKNYNLPIPRPPQRTSKLLKKPSALKRDPGHWPSWIRIRIPNPDPLTRLNPDPIRIRIRNPDFFGTNHTLYIHTVLFCDHIGVNFNWDSIIKQYEGTLFFLITIAQLKSPRMPGRNPNQRPAMLQVSTLTTWLFRNRTWK